MKNAIESGQRRFLPTMVLCALPVVAPSVQAQERPVELDALEVVGRRINLVGEAVSASEGLVGREEIAARPLLRTGDLIEFVPGLVATQHSGNGKANQYFLRGFNLDHGTDFATSVDGMPVNLSTHGHGQGYTDLNFLIPELVETLAYRKGTYYADVGDFSSAGSAQFRISDRLDQGFAELGVGNHGYGRLLLADSFAAGYDGELLIGGELERYDGAWTDLDEDLRKKNLVLRYSQALAGGTGHVMLMGYDNRWNAPDQIPARAVDSGLISRLGSIDPDLGGESSRYSLSGGWEGTAWGGHLAASAYAIDYDFKLWSNFTYWLEDPDQGDQFQQVDQRRIYGFDVSQQWAMGQAKWRIGAQGRRDDIDQVGLFHTAARSVLAPIRDDRVDQTSLGVYAANEYQWLPNLRSYVGLRYDHYDFDVDALQPENSGSASDGTASAKASLIWRVADPLELYLGWGQGFHSNDARGTTLAVDPVSGEPADPVDPLVDSRGAELGARLFMGEKFHATVALWNLRLDSELLFVGDAGNTEASRPSRREGAELGVYWFPDPRIRTDLELSWTRARFGDESPDGSRIPGALPFVANLGVQADLGSGWSTTARLRHFGRYPLIEDNSERSDGSTILNVGIGKTWRRFSLGLDILNALDSRDHDIDYFYASRLPMEPEDGVEDTHYHPMEPRSYRLTARLRF